MKKFIYCALYLPLLCATVRAQVPDSSLLLPVITVLAGREQIVALGERVERWDSLGQRYAALSSVADLLSREGGIYIKSYGVGSLATASLRGGAAGQQLLLWNGLPIVNPSLGLLDFSLLPLLFTDKINIHYGGLSALWGSGAMGGAINLQNTPAYGQRLLAEGQLSAGGFGLVDGQLRLGAGGQRWTVQSRFFRRTADNDFTFRPAAGLPARKQQHAALEGVGWLQSVHWKIGPRQQLALFHWTQRQFREIPPTLVQTRSEATQADSILRTALHWQRSADRWLLQLRTAFFRERIQYNDPAIRLFSPSSFASWLTDAEASFPLGKTGQLQGGVTNMYTQATTTAYPEGAAVTMHQLAVFGSWRRQWAAVLASQLSLRQEWIDGRPQKLLPTLSLRSQLSRSLWLRAQLARSFRFPTLNDRYWQPGGQPDLLPEYAWSQELGLSYAPGQNWQFSVTGYHRYVHNWILWYPVPGQLFWSAANATAVRASGLEIRLQYARRLRQWQFRCMAGYDYTRAINQIALQRPLMKVGKQLAYTPLHQAFASVLIEYKHWKMSYQQRYTGAVSTLTEPLSGYLPAFAQLDYQHDKYGFTTFIQINNVWNTDYQAVERRPMPGRHWLLGCRLRLHK